MSIPRTIWQVWLGGHPPPEVGAWMRSWLNLPGWRYHLVGDDEARGRCHPDLLDVYDRADSLAMPGRGHQVRSDLLRWSLLHRNGGIYVDADFELLGDPERLLVGEAFAGWEVPDQWVNMALCGAVPGHPFLAALIARAPANVARYADHRPAGITSSTSLTGPRFLTPVWHEFADSVHVHPKELLYPYDWSQVGTDAEKGPWPGAIAVHHWMNRRRIRGLIKLEGD